MLDALGKIGATGVLHRYMPIDEQARICNSIDTSSHTARFFVAVGATGDYLERVDYLWRFAGINRFCVDVANGHNVHCLNAVRAIKDKIHDSYVMAGNVCTYIGVLRLVEAGADLIRVGIGSGAVCTTRVVTGHGLPQMSAIEDCARIHMMYPNVVIIADGGIRCSGDIVKALAIGADTVMIGSLLAGTEETPGEFIEEGDRLVKYYAGMASEKARESHFDKSRAGLPVEGVSIKVPYTGKSAAKVVENLCKSVRVGLSYSGAMNIQELQAKAVFRQVTSAGYVEGTPHGRSR